jgi:hypothetical protein
LEFGSPEQDMKIGISGHQNLGTADVIDWTRAQIREELRKRDFACGVSSLADGADQLFAAVVIDFGKVLEVVIPCRGYEAAFTNPVAAKRFRDLKQRASKSYVLDFEGPSEKAFYEAGKRVVDMSDLMIAVWNGKPAKGLGGTADIVAYARKARKPVWCINPETITCGP